MPPLIASATAVSKGGIPSAVQHSRCAESLKCDVGLVVLFGLPFIINCRSVLCHLVVRSQRLRCCGYLGSSDLRLP